CLFQAEDGIRGFHVTGVQTCALPIYEHASIRQERQSPRRVQRIGDDLDAQGSSERLIRRRRLRAYETNTTGDDERLAHALRDHQERTSLRANMIWNRYPPTAPARH